MLGIGEYPPEFNPKVHGPYYPDRFYGKPDTAFSQVKLGELPGWLKRRNYSPVAMARAVDRGIWRWQLRWFNSKHRVMSGMVQAVMALSLYYYINQYPNLKYHRHCKYH